MGSEQDNHDSCGPSLRTAAVSCECSSDGATPDDGRFEVALLPKRSKLRLLATAVEAATRGLGAQPSTTRFSFRIVQEMTVQLDGETVTLAARTDVTVDVRRGAHATLG